MISRNFAHQIEQCEPFYLKPAEMSTAHVWVVSRGRELCE